MAEPNERSWEDHWKERHTPWDAGESAPALKSLVQSGRLEKLAARPLVEVRALVPGCGSGYDVFTLAEAGVQTVGLDLAPSARSRFDRLRQERGLSERQASLDTVDFFDWSPEVPFDLVWDYTFYCAIDPSQRDAWRARMKKLLRSGGILAMLLFPVVPNAPPDQGPPYALDPEEVKSRLSKDFTPISLERVVRSHEGREGKEWLGLWRHP